MSKCLWLVQYVFLMAIKKSRYRCQLAISWKVCFWIRKEWFMFIFFSCSNSLQYYINFLRNDVHQAIWKERLWKPSKIIILLHDSAHPHTVNRLHSQDKTFYSAGTSNLPGWCKKCVSVKGEYLEKEQEFGDSGMNILIVRKENPDQPGTTLITFTSETTSTMSTASWCKDLRAEWTSAVYHCETLKWVNFIN
jgi:hypothetical protein